MIVLVFFMLLFSNCRADKIKLYGDKLCTEIIEEKKIQKKINKNLIKLYNLGNGHQYTYNLCMRLYTFPEHSIYLNDQNLVTFNDINIKIDEITSKLDDSSKSLLKTIKADILQYRKIRNNIIFYSKEIQFEQQRSKVNRPPHFFE